MPFEPTYELLAWVVHQVEAALCALRIGEEAYAALTGDLQRHDDLPEAAPAPFEQIAAVRGDWKSYERGDWDAAIRQHLPLLWLSEGAGVDEVSAWVDAPDARDRWWQYRFSIDFSTSPPKLRLDEIDSE